MTGRKAVNLYQMMLGLAADVTAPDHYQLLGLQRFEADQEAIRNGAADANGELLKWQNAPDYFREADRLMDEVAAARDVLLDPEQKAEYDSGLRRELGIAEPEPATEDEPLSAYRRMLGLAGDVTTPDHYQLLGLQHFESDEQAIRNAAGAAKATLLKWKDLVHRPEANQVLEEVALARDVLLDAKQRAKYDAELRRRLVIVPRIDDRPKSSDQRSDQPSRMAGSPGKRADDARGMMAVQPHPPLDEAPKVIPTGPSDQDSDEEEYTLAPIDESPPAPLTTARGKSPDVVSAHQNAPKSDEEYTLASAGESPISSVPSGPAKCPWCQAAKPPEAAMCPSCGMGYGTGRPPTRNEAEAKKDKAKSQSDEESSALVLLGACDEDEAPHETVTALWLGVAGMAACAGAVLLAGYLGNRFVVHGLENVAVDYYDIDPSTDLYKDLLAHVPEYRKLAIFFMLIGVPASSFTVRSLAVAVWDVAVAVDVPSEQFPVRLVACAIRCFGEIDVLVTKEFHMFVGSVALFALGVGMYAAVPSL